MSSRVMPRRLAIRSAAVNWSGRSMSQDSARQLRSGPALAPSPTRLIASMPQAMPTSIAPMAISPAIRWLACWPLPHWQSTVVAPTCSGKPAVSQAVRVMLLDCSRELGHAAADQLFDVTGVDTGLVDQCSLHPAQQLRRVQA